MVCYNTKSEVKTTMVFDGMVTRAISYELTNELVDGRVMKIYQPNDTEIFMVIRHERNNKQLLLSAHPQYARIHITEDKRENPTEPPVFCMILRKHLTGSFVKKIEQQENERILHIHFQTRNEIGDISNKILVVEIMGKHSNLILIDDDSKMIIDSIKHISHSQNRHRIIIPGASYTSPPDQGKINPFTMEKDRFMKRLDFNAGKLEQQIVHQFMGVSPLFAKEVTHRAKLGNKESYMHAFLDMMESLQQHKYEPAIWKADKESFYILPLHTKDGTSREDFPSISTMLDRFYSGKAERDRVVQRAQDLSRVLLNEQKKNHRKLAILEKTLKESDKADDYQRKGELLTAHLHLVKTGDEKVDVVDYYDPEQKQIEISLNKQKTPSENAQAFFKKYHKLKKAKIKAQEEINKTIEEIGYLDGIIEQIGHAREQDIEEIREELRDQGYLKKKSTPNKQRKNKPTKPKPQLYVSSDGIDIYVGKNNKQNDYLTNQLARRNDIWLHTKDIPGSHVVIRTDDPTEQTLHEAAQLAAYFSKAGNSSSVPVDYTEVKHVKKPNGAKPGYVIYDNQKTLFVTPDTAVVEKLDANKKQN